MLKCQKYIGKNRKVFIKLQKTTNLNYASNIKVSKLNYCDNKLNHEKCVILKTYKEFLKIWNLLIPNIENANNPKLEKLSSISLINQKYLLDLKSEFKYQVLSNSRKLNSNKKNIKFMELYSIQNDFIILHNQIKFDFLNKKVYNDLSSSTSTFFDKNKLYDLVFSYYHFVLQGICLQNTKNDYLYSLNNDKDLISKIFDETNSKLNNDESSKNLIIEKELLERFIEKFKMKILYKKINFGNLDLTKNTKSIDISKLCYFIFIGILKSIECKQFISNLISQVSLTIEACKDNDNQTINKIFGKFPNPQKFLILQFNVINYIQDMYNKQYIPHIEYDNKDKINDVNLKNIEIIETPNNFSINKKTKHVLNLLKLKQSLNLFNIPTTNIFLSEEINMTEDYLNNIILKSSKKD